MRTLGTSAKSMSAPSGVTDPTPGNNSATDSDTITASADLAVTATGPATAVAGQTIAYSITVNNPGPSNAASVSLTDTLAAGVTFVSLASPGGWTCTTPAVGASGRSVAPIRRSRRAARARSR